MFKNDENGQMTDEGTRTTDFNKVYEAAPIETEPKKPANRWALRDRLRSKVLWAAVVGGVMQIFSALGLWAKLGITAAGFSEIMVAVGAILEAFGVFNDPTSKERF